MHVARILDKDRLEGEKATLKERPMGEVGAQRGEGCMRACAARVARRRTVVSAAARARSFPPSLPSLCVCRARVCAACDLAWTNRFGSQQWLTKRATLPVREASTQSSGLSCVLASTPLGPSCDVFLRLATCPFSSPSRLKRYESSTLKRYLQVNLFKRLKKRYESSTSQARGQSQAAGPRPGLEARAPLETGRLEVNQQ